MPKTLPTSVLLRDGEVSDAFVREKLERRAAYNTIRTICGMTEAAVGGGLMNRCKLPPEMDGVMRLELGCKLVRGLAGMEVHDASGTVTPVIPSSFSSTRLCIINNTIDRCGIGAAGMACCLSHLRMTWTAHWGPLHDSWNAIRTSAKKTRSGSIWRALVRFSGVANLPFGPFRSTA